VFSSLGAIKIQGMMEIKGSGSQPSGILLRPVSIFAKSYDATGWRDKKGGP